MVLFVVGTNSHAGSDHYIKMILIVVIIMGVSDKDYVLFVLVIVLVSSLLFSHLSPLHI